ncbi:cation/H(+) antiporter 15-like [Musa acuminata AAA Group]|uniref:cation/H(+) antiporter 15-like n=1 Tax=Musa acuminata AAA Group TaxID=214697 RepID=UPI0031DE8E95
MATAAGGERPKDVDAGATAAGPKAIYCYHAMLATSAGVWLGDNPFRFSLPLLFYQIIIIFVVSNLTHAVLRRLGQPLVISQIVAGLLLGPNFLGRNLWFSRVLFAHRSFQQLQIISIVSTMIFVFVVGVKADLGMIPRVRKKALSIAVLGTLLPYVSVYGMAAALRPQMPPRFANSSIFIVLARTWCISSYTVVSCLLRELNLVASRLGRLAMSAILMADFIHVFADACVGTYLMPNTQGAPLNGFSAICSFLGLVVIVMFIMRPLVLWFIRQTPEGALLSGVNFVAVLLMALASGLMTHIFGFHYYMGPFFFGLVLPGGAPLGTTLVDRLEALVTGVLLPVTMAIAGMHTDLTLMADPRQWGWLGGFLVLAVVTKFVGVILPCVYSRMPHRETVTLGLMMISKGIYELGTAVGWRETEIVDSNLYTVLVVSILVLGGGTAPLIKYLYRPEDHYVAHKRRTLQHAMPGDELRVLACIHEQDNVNPVLALLEASGPFHDAPICVYLLHLMQLVGRSDAVLHPYKLKNSSSGSSATALSESDHIVNAFRLFQKQYPDGISVLPYVCISPYSTMHDGVCCLAHDKKATLVIVPFHKHIIADGSISSASSAVQAVNLNILRYAPCSVGILIDHGSSDGGLLVHRVAVYFVGGPDDREALAYGVRMADHAAAELTVVRFLLPKEWRAGGREERIDDRVLMHFQRERVDGKRVVYREEVVKDGEGTVAVIRKTSHEFSLLIVGRRQGEESPVTAGMSMWNEYPELGVMGDMLASTDFGGQASTLVVQQQKRVIRTQSTDDPETTRPRTRTPTPTPTPTPTGKRVVPREDDDY